MGRQGGLLKHRSSASNLGGAASRSFVFRSEDSQSAVDADVDDASGDRVRQPVVNMATVSL